MVLCDNRRDALCAGAAGVLGRRPGLEAPGSGTDRGEGRAMADLLNLAMLVCAAAGSMAFGILGAYAILRVGFALMRPQRRPVAVKPQVEAARVS